MERAAIIDSSVWIGYRSARDQWHRASHQIIEAFLEGSIHTAHVTDYVVLETVNFLLRKERHSIAYDALVSFGMERVKIHYIDSISMEKIKKVFSLYPSLSLTDCSLVALAEELQLPIFSFDTALDRVKSVTRRGDF